MVVVLVSILLSALSGEPVSKHVEHTYSQPEFSDPMSACMADQVGRVSRNSKGTVTIYLCEVIATPNDTKYITWQAPSPAGARS